MINIADVLQLKTGARANGMQPEILLAIMVAYTLYTKHGYGTIITELVGGKHGRGSLHYVGLAVDLRTNHIPEDYLKTMLRDEISEALGDEYDVVLERDHLHIEFQPK